MKYKDSHRERESYSRFSQVGAWARSQYLRHCRIITVQTPANNDITCTKYQRNCQCLWMSRESPIRCLNRVHTDTNVTLPNYAHQIICNCKIWNNTRVLGYYITSLIISVLPVEKSLFEAPYGLDEMWAWGWGLSKIANLHGWWGLDICMIFSLP